MGDGARCQDGAYVAADESKPGEERALEGRLAEKVIGNFPYAYITNHPAPRSNE